MWVRPSTILLKDPVASEKFIPIFKCKGKHFFDINNMINCSFIQNHQRRDAVGTATQLNHYFLWKFLFLLNVTFFIGIGTTDCPHPIILRVIGITNVKELPIWKENCHGVFFPKIGLNPICKFFYVWSLDHLKAMVRLLFYGDVALNRFSLFAERFRRKYQVPSIVFELILFCCDVNVILLFWILPFVLTKHRQHGAVDSTIEPDRQII